MSGAFTNLKKLTKFSSLNDIRTKNKGYSLIIAKISH